MITKTEVHQAIARCEPHAGFATIDNTPVHPGAITLGDLHTLIEAAKCARYRNAAHSTAGSDTDWVLNDEERKPDPGQDTDDEID